MRIYITYHKKKYCFMFLHHWTNKNELSKKNKNETNKNKWYLYLFRSSRQAEWTKLHFDNNESHLHLLNFEAFCDVRWSWIVLLLRHSITFLQLANTDNNLNMKFNYIITIINTSVQLDDINYYKSVCYLIVIIIVSILYNLSVYASVANYRIPSVFIHLPYN